MPNRETPTNSLFSSGGGEMGQLMRSKNWSETSLGHPDTWPQSLLTTLSIILHSKFPMFLFWGPDHLCFYNDAYRPSLGMHGKHPESLGKKAIEVWPEIWDDIYPLIQQVMSGGGATWAEDQLLPIYRNGKLEDVYWTFSYSPVTDEAGNVSAVFVTCTETTAKVKAFHELEESKNLLEFATDSAELGTWDYHPASKKFSANRRLNAWFGLPPDKLIDFDYAISVIHPKDRERTFKALTHALNYLSGGYYNIEYTIINPVNKKEIIVHAKGRAWFTDDGEVYRFNGIMQDVTKQVLARRKVEESEYRLHTLIEESDIAMGLYTGEELKIQYANEALLNFYGKTEAIIGMPLQVAVPELNDQPYLKILQHVFVTGNAYKAKEEPITIQVDEEPQTFYFDITFKALRNKDGSIFGIHHIALDVTQKVLSTQALQKSEEKFRHTVEQAPLGITILRGKDYVIEMANKTYLRIINKTEQEFVGKPLFHSLPQVKDAVDRILADVLKSGKPYYGIEFPVYIDNNQPEKLTYFNFIYQPLLETNGEIEGILVVASDVTESVMAKHDLAESERQFRNMVMQSPIPMTILRGKDYIVEIANNVMFQTIWRKRPGDVLGRPILEVFPELNTQKYPELLNKVYTTGISHTETESIAHILGEDGMKKFYLDFEYAPLLDPTQKISGIIITVSDVTEKVEARIKAQESEQRLNLVIEASELGTWQLDLQTNEIKYSERLVEIFGYDEKSNLTHRHLLRRLHPDDVAIRNSAFEKGMETGVIQYESRLVWPNGSLRWVEVKGKISLDENGKPLRLLGTTRDKTEEKHQQQELEDRERKFRLLADSMPQLVWTASTYGDVNYFNQSVYNYSGLDEKELLKNGWLQLIHPDEKEESRNAWNLAVESGEDFIIEHRFLRADGQYRWQLTRAIPQRDFLGNIRMWVGTSTDIQEIKELDEQKNLFIGIASHELKTPITTVKGYVQLLQDMYTKNDDEFLTNSLDKIHKQIETITDLIGDLLDLSKIKAGSLNYNKEDFNLTELVDEVLNSTRDINPYHVIEIERTENVFVNADRNRIGQVIINLLTNAIKYSPESKYVKVTIRTQNNKAIVLVEDRGIGIIKTDQKKIFERFYRVEGNNEKIFPGFGIGLFISSEIIKKHAGEIGVESEQGVGSVFYFSLPLINPIYE